MSDRRGKRRRVLAGGAVLSVLLIANGPAAAKVVSEQLHQFRINQPSYKRQYGHWQTVSLPSRYRVNAVHTMLLQTGKLLVIAGTGNDTKSFAAGTFKTLLWDPQTNSMKLLPTPSDMFCGGHSFLNDGKILVAGGTQRYEALAPTHAGGPITITNKSPAGPHRFAKGTNFTAPDGSLYLSNADVTVPAAASVMTGRGRARHAAVTPATAPVWVDAATSGRRGLQAAAARYSIPGLSNADRDNLFGTGGAVTLAKQNYQGSELTYVFDPITERYNAVLPMTHKRWYPTLAPLRGGDVLAVSGLDGTGQVSAGQTEIFSPLTRAWRAGPFRYFPTYPTLLLMANGNLFYSGSNTGYGPGTVARAPGIWDTQANTFQLVPGLRAPDALETSASVMLPPAQRQRVMILGGGGVGESQKSTRRTAIVDLRAHAPAFAPGPDLPAPTRYPNAVVLPNDTVFVSGGSRYYRGEHQSDTHSAEIYDPDRNTFTTAAASAIGRDYHSEALLLPDGRVATLGSNPLFSDAADTRGAKFEQRVEIYSPPYLFQGPRPTINAGPRLIARGGRATFATSDSATITKARLIHPSAATHVTDLAQRSVALPFKRTAAGISVVVPAESALLPSGWYMLFVDSAKGVPSIARWVQVQ